ncbi:MAG TPA: glycosyltransferase family 2 protein [Bacteroidia bacterium]|nr:glycosyltransferase family 2 protein [Bacteroidia bacterium]
MFISGFTFVRNAVKYDYPVEASVRSMLPLVDELIVCLGNSDDTTESLINSIADPKIKIVHSTWDDSLREGGRVLAVETNKALDAVNQNADWCIYLQADEVIHEEDYTSIRSAMTQYKDQKNVEGLLFKYLHFYGNYNYIGDSRKWYRYEIRIIRNDKNIRSYKDAQGFRYGDRKLNVKEIPARIFHYGWVKNPLHQSEKQKNFHKLWHSDEAVKKKVKDDLFDYSAIDSLALFKQTHPSVMQKRIDEVNWEFTYDVAKKKLKLKDSILLAIEKSTGYRFFEYKNYQKI